ncbi:MULTISPECIES: ABC transporter ATP-binding protein/permease [unclassified Azospirillum]|uniref:ABC transporter ATP-binding protein/permease n=1 Tax=unclassified Azospirillum TaxID=2630922 RepID=UPI000B75A95F|nr:MULTISPECIES: ABC transporter ATP-binding protein/permease [unclassified Azospirillum]SNS51721.1 putative ATP-binding cassette transporter [Azospirillum sp. RU38E]SNS69796.1 putative ATP-binding cassette transporter [Azospirillum sp. RU37A]
MHPQPTQTGEVRRETGLAPPPPAGERWRHAFGLFKAYWTSKHWKFAWANLILQIGLQFGTAYIFLASNRWQRDFFDSVEKRDVEKFGILLFVFLGIMLMQVGAILVNGLLDKLLSIRWRSFITEQYIDRWMSRNRFAEIERLRLIDNPDQRIAVDVDAVTNASIGMLSVILGFIGSTVGAITFAMVLLETAEPIRFDLLGMAINIPGSTVWYACIYALAGSLLMVKVGQPYIQAVMRQQHREADFRANLIHVRRNASQIGLAGAVGLERQALKDSFAEIRRNYRSVILTSLGLTGTQSVYERIGTILPLFLMVPSYFAGAISFGQVMGGRDAFSQLVMQLSYFVQTYPRIGEQLACLNRLKGLDDSIDYERPRGISIGAGALAPGQVIATHDLALFLPHGAPLLHVGDWQVGVGERWAVCGPSGAGKSTLLRAIAGLWPDGKGAVTMTPDTVAMFVPQRLYLPLGTLKAALCFPDLPEAHTDAEIIQLLERVRLGNLAERLHVTSFLQEELSPGEQQRIALARILLHRPSVLVLDEATSALDPDNARHFYECLRNDLPHSTVISIVHDERLLAHHDRCLTIADGVATAAALPGKNA